MQGQILKRFNTRRLPWDVTRSLLVPGSAGPEQATPRIDLLASSIGKRYESDLGPVIAAGVMVASVSVARAISQTFGCQILQLNAL
jgi:hypothetical protein